MNAHSLMEQVDLCGNTKGTWNQFTLPLASGKTSAQLTLTGATNPSIGVSSNQSRITWSALDTAALQFGGWTFPRNADTCEINSGNTDRGAWLILDAVLTQAGTTDTITMTASFYARTPGSSTQKGPFTATATLTTGSVPTRTSFAFKVSTDASGNKLEPGDTIESFTLTPGTHNNDPIYLTALSVRYKGTIGFAKDSDRFAVS